MRVRIDYTGHYKEAGSIYYFIACRCGNVLAYLAYLTVFNQYIGVLQCALGYGKHGSILDEEVAFFYLRICGDNAQQQEEVTYNFLMVLKYYRFGSFLASTGKVPKVPAVAAFIGIAFNGCVYFDIYGLSVDLDRVGILEAGAIERYSLQIEGLRYHTAAYGAGVAGSVFYKLHFLFVLTLRYIGYSGPRTFERYFNAGIGLWLIGNVLLEGNTVYKHIAYLSLLVKVRFIADDEVSHFAGSTEPSLSDKPSNCAGPVVRAARA